MTKSSYMGTNPQVAEIVKQTQANTAASIQLLDRCDGGGCAMLLANQLVVFQLPTVT